MDWTTIKIENVQHIIKYVNGDEKFIVLLSDFKELWKETISWVEIQERAKSVNTLLNIDEKTVEQTLLSISENYTFNCNDGHFKLKYYIGGIPFHFFWKLILCGHDLFYEEITKKLLVTVINLQQQKNVLIEVVTKKDTEIKQYKIEGATLIRKHVATPTFNSQEFERKFRLKKDSGLIDLTKDINSNEMKNMCNYENQIEKDDKRATKFQPKKEKKIIYESNSMEMELDSESATTVTTNPTIIEDATSTSQSTAPKRKLLRSKLNL